MVGNQPLGNFRPLDVFHKNLCAVGRDTVVPRPQISVVRNCFLFELRLDRRGIDLTFRRPTVPNIFVLDPIAVHTAFSFALQRSDKRTPDGESMVQHRMPMFEK
jgi:hypothetical protein